MKIKGCLCLILSISLFVTIGSADTGKKGEEVVSIKKNEGAALERDQQSANRTQSIAEILAKNRESRRSDSENNNLSEPGNGLSFLKMLEALGLVAGVFLIAMHFYKKYAAKAEVKSGKKIRIIERTSITAKSALIMAEVEGRRILIGVGPDPITIAPLYSVAESDNGQYLRNVDGYEDCVEELCLGPEVVKLSA